ncbi:MAG: hypothetical protein HKN42_13290 [Granulosicoccus sp.]|nr:hypothetical protein [Granulosicoccus sp.]
MKHCQRKTGKSLILLPLLSCLLILLAACADKSELRQQERDRYRALEDKLISAQEAQESRRRSEMRVAQRLQQLDRERAEAARARLQARNDARSASTDAADERPDADKLSTSSTRRPIVTQLIVAESDTQEGSPLWSVTNFPNPVDGSALCSVVSRPVTVMNGTLETQVTLIISDSAVILRTDATFDDAAPETGFRVDAGFPVAFDHFLNELTAVVDDSYPRLIEAIENGSTLTVSFAYDPQLSTAETHVMEFSLDSMAALLDQLPDCQTQRSEATISNGGDSSGS